MNVTPEIMNIFYNVFRIDFYHCRSPFQLKTFAEFSYEIFLIKLHSMSKSLGIRSVWCQNGDVFGAYTESKKQ